MSHLWRCERSSPAPNQRAGVRLNLRFPNKFKCKLGYEIASSLPALLATPFVMIYLRPAKVR